MPCHFACYLKTREESASSSKLLRQQCLSAISHHKIPGLFINFKKEINNFLATFCSKHHFETDFFVGARYLYVLEQHVLLNFYYFHIPSVLSVCMSSICDRCLNVGMPQKRNSCFFPAVSRVKTL